MPGSVAFKPARLPICFFSRSASPAGSARGGCVSRAPLTAHTDPLAPRRPRELAAGLAEVIKYGLIRDPTLFEWLAKNMARLATREAEPLTHAIERSCAIKAEIVAQDEREDGVRALLNLGHTFGHAIEAGTGYGTW